MAIGPLSPTAGVDYTTANTAAGATGTTLVLNKPSGLTNGDVLFLFIQNHNNSGIYTPPSGFTVVYSLSTRKGGLAYKVITDAASEPATYTGTFNSAGRLAGTLFRLSGVDNANPIDAVSSAETAGAAGTVNIAAISPTTSNALLLTLIAANPGSSSTGANFTWGNSVTERVKATAPGGSAATIVAVGNKQLSSSGSTGVTSVSGVAVPGGGVSTPVGHQVALRTDSSAPVLGSLALTGEGTLSVTGQPGATGTVALSGSGSLSLSADGSYNTSLALSGEGTLTITGSNPVTSGSLELSGSGSLLVAKYSPLDAWMANTPMWVSHRGGSVSWPEHTMFAYDQSVAWRSDLALEVSVWKSADGVWVCNHDNDPTTGGHWSGPSANITSRNWFGDLGTNVFSNPGGYVMIRLDDLLAKYGNSRILVIDNKASADMTGFLNLLDSYAGNTRYIIKGFYQDQAKANAARARGYQTWGYYYDTDVAQISSTHAPWTILGMNNSASSASWAAIKAVGKPVWAHIIQTPAAFAQAAAFNPQGYMVSGVQAVVPQTPAPVALSGAGDLALSSRVGQSGTLALSGAGTLGATGRPTIQGGLTLSSDGDLSGDGVPRFAIAVNLSGDGTLTIQAAGAPGGDVALSGSGTLSINGAPATSTTLSLSGGGTLTIIGSRPATDKVIAMLAGQQVKLMLNGVQVKLG